MANILNPARVLVISVGIEKYDYGSEMKLQGAGNQAARFAHWALVSGVPRERVWLACELLRDSTAELPSCRRIGTKRADLEDVFAKDLSKVDADMLLFYWCGHGVVNEKRERALFTSDTYPGMDRNLVVDNILSFLSSEAVTGLTQQIMIIDACANFVEKIRLGRVLPSGTLQPRSGRRVDQYLLYSASQGEFAEFDQVRHQSTFSETVLDGLERQPPGRLPPDMGEVMESLSKKVQDVFNQRYVGGGARQTPGTYITQTYPGDERPVFQAGGLPVAGNTQRFLKSVGMTVRQAQRVREAIESLPPIGQTQVRTEMLTLLGDHLDKVEAEDLGISDLVARVFAGRRSQRLLRALEGHAKTDQQRMDVAGLRVLFERQERISKILQQLTPVTRKQVNEAFWWALADRPHEHPKDLDDALDRVAEYGLVSGNLALHRFIAYLRHETNQPIPDEWFGLSADRLNGLKEEIEDALADTARLVIEIPNGAHTPSCFVWPAEILNYRRMPGHEEWMPQEAVPCLPSREGVKEAVRGLLTDMEENYTSIFTLGFMMPRIAFDEFPELWTHGSLYVEDRPLWRGRPTVLHSSERRTSKSISTVWNEKTKLIGSQLERAEKADMAWIEAALQDNPEGIRSAVARYKAACYGLAFIPGKFKGSLPQDPLIAALASGAPFVMWIEEEPPDWEAAKKRLDELIAQGRFEDLPLRLHRLREDEQSGLGSIVRLIWDDPRVLPDIPQLSGMKGVEP